MQTQRSSFYLAGHWQSIWPEDFFSVHTTCMLCYLRTRICRYLWVYSGQSAILLPVYTVPCLRPRSPRTVFLKTILLRASTISYLVWQTIIRVLLCQPLLNFEDASMWSDRNCCFRTSEGTAWSLPSQGISIFIAINPTDQGPRGALLCSYWIGPTNCQHF
jgi:hypothetical protein